jgi:hypothetical protein
MNVRMIDLPCPRCDAVNALRCMVVTTGEGLWVSRYSQMCTCDVYTAWNRVWWDARRRIHAWGERNEP